MKCKIFLEDNVIALEEEINQFLENKYFENFIVKQSESVFQDLNGWTGMITIFYEEEL